MAFVLRIPVTHISRLLAAGLLLLGMSAHVHADSFDQGSAMKMNPGDFDDDDDGKSWQEIKTEIPPAPQAANLVSFYVSPTA
ncbi:MAG TPA: hypothetical protein VNW52_02610, partial [Burkholderiaceae bacterium]|nr:hypothetical protein [Burkholderiaceae bacterium]